jgi:quinol monooxygenase YgiN
MLQSSDPASDPSAIDGRMGSTGPAAVPLGAGEKKTMMVLVASYRCQPGRGDEVAAALREMLPASRAEPGCLLYLVNRSTEDPDHFVLYEHYQDEQALQRHRESSHFQRIVAGQVIPKLAAREWEHFALLEG